MDTHAAVVRLTEAGMTEPQATAIVSTVRLAVDDGVATKTDAAALGAAIANLEARLTRLVLLTSGATIAALVALLKL